MPLSNNYNNNSNKKRISLRPYEPLKNAVYTIGAHSAQHVNRRRSINKHGFAFCTLPVLLLLLFFEYGSVYFYQTTGIIKKK